MWRTKGQVHCLLSLQLLFMRYSWEGFMLITGSHGKHRGNITHCTMPHATGHRWSVCHTLGHLEHVRHLPGLTWGPWENVVSQAVLTSWLGNHIHSKHSLVSHWPQVAEESSQVVWDRPSYHAVSTRCQLHHNSNLVIQLKLNIINCQGKDIIFLVLLINSCFFVLFKFNIMKW